MGFMILNVIIKMDQQQEINSFLETQFFFYLLPCYYGVIAFAWRYWKVIQTQPTYYTPKIIGEKFIKLLQTQQQRNRNSDTLTYKVLPASYVIKSKLSLLNSYLYLLMIFLSFICTPSLFYSANHMFYSLLYIFGFLAWYFAAIILRRQYQRQMGQSIWIHRLFWILAGTFSIYKMFEDYFLPLNLIFNCFFIATNVVLAIYGIYRPQDSDILQISVRNDEVPGFIKIFFQMIELNQKIRWVFQIQDQINENININEVDITRADLSKDDLVAIGTAFKHSAENIKNQINLLNELPRRNVFVDKRIRYIKVNDKYKSCYFILSQVGNDRVEIQRTLDQFTKLYNTMKQIFSPQNFPKHPLPKFIGFYSPIEGESAPNQNFLISQNKSQNIEKWLDQIFKTPIFMIGELLTFLNFTNELAAPFTTYFQHSYKMFCSKHYLLLQLNRQKKQTKTQGKEIEQLSGYFNGQIITKEETDHQKLVKMVTNKLDFSIQTEIQSSNQVQFNFIINCIVDKKIKYRWNITKTQQNILGLNEKIEDDCNCSVPFFYRLTAIKRKNYKDKLEVFRGYIQNLLKQKTYYSTSLFFFIRFDPVKLEINLTGTPFSFSSVEQADLRKSRYLSEYEDKGAFIEVLRIDRVQKDLKGEDILKFKLRRNSIELSNKTTQQLKNLRNKLTIIYKGVSFIPEVDFKNCKKSEAKSKIENFLLKIENLPKIEINEDYLNFYEHSLCPACDR